MLKELFPDWTDADLVLAIEDSDGDLERTIEKISEGKCAFRFDAHMLLRSIPPIAPHSY